MYQVEGIINQKLTCNLSPKGGMGYDLINRLKFALQRSNIEHDIEELHYFVTDFNVLGNHVAEILEKTERNYNTTKLKGSKVGGAGNLRVYKRTRNASAGLYTTIASRWACGMHEEHTVNIRLSGDESNTTVSHDTKFILGMRSSDGSSFPEDTMWLDVIHTEQTGTSEDVVDHMNSGAENAKGQKSKEVQSLLNLLEKGSQKFVTEFPVRTKENLRKRHANTVHFHPNSPLNISEVNNKRAKTERPKGGIHLLGPALDLHTVNDYCLHFRNGCQQNSEQTILGYLSDCYIQKFYASSSILNANSEPLSLHDIVKDISEGSLINILPRKTVLEIGKSLAEIVLPFYSTPWLPHDWESKDICYFRDSKRVESQGNWSNLYLAVNLTKRGHDNGKGKQKRAVELLGSVVRPTSQQSSVIEERLSLRNETLFGLGVMLLEIGYSKPWEILRRKASGQPSDYLAAQHLTRDLSRYMGPAYSCITRKCLGCDFGLGETDLDDEELQRTFIKQVIEALENVEKGRVALYQQ